MQSDIVLALVLLARIPAMWYPAPDDLIPERICDEFHRNDEAGDSSIGRSDDPFGVYQREKAFCFL
jgi:hypothetical protein